MPNWGKLEDFIYWAVTGIAGAIASFGLLLIRKVFTSEKKIALLEADLERREKARGEDRERMAGIESGIAAIQNVLMGSGNGGQSDG